MKRARVYRRGPRLFLHAVSRTATGAWVLAGPVVVADLVEVETFLGEAITDALAASRSGARDTSGALRRQILEKARSKNWSTFLRGTTVCDIEQDEAGIRLFPAKNATRRPFVAQGTAATTLGPKALAIDVGWAVKAALRSLEPKRRPKRRATV